METRLLMQGNPAKALELFAKLSDPSEAGAKARSKLFAELKGELDLHLKIEDEHLLPILQKNPETKALALEGVRNNREMRLRLATLDAMPKNDPTFLTKLKELQQAFRHHARDEKNELLPAVQKALADHQQSAVVSPLQIAPASAIEHKSDRSAHSPVNLPASRTSPQSYSERVEAEAEPIHQSGSKAEQPVRAPISQVTSEKPQAARPTPAPSFVDLFLWPWAGTLQALQGRTTFPAVRGASSVEEVVPLREEVLEIGKRLQNHGTVRIHRHVVETPVEERVTLQSERVIVERRRPAVDRITGEIFTDLTIEVTETREEPVVTKNVRLREEVVIGTERSQRVEVIHEVLRRDEIQVEHVDATEVRQLQPIHQRVR